MLLKSFLHLFPKAGDYTCQVTVLDPIGQKATFWRAPVVLGPKTEETVRQWRFGPARKGGRTVPVVVSIDVNYWTTSTGEIVSDPPHPLSSVQSEEPGKETN